jgi:hypothetical protein
VFACAAPGSDATKVKGNNDVISAMVLIYTYSMQTIFFLSIDLHVGSLLRPGHRAGYGTREMKKFPLGMP